jgi:subtilisin family serine protease
MGAGVLIAVIDTGIRLDHADLAGRLWDGGAEYPHHGYDFYYHDNDPSDDWGHGTHVAGTICGTGASGSQTGIAPEATIMALKTFNSDGVGEETHWLAAMQFALEHGADLMNMSLGRPQPNPAQKLMTRQACDNTLAAGVVVAACAGNIRQMQFMVPVPNNIYTPGDCPPPHLHEDQLVNAGGTSCVICIGAVNYDNTIASFSSEGPSQWTDVTAYNDYPYTAGSTTEIGLIRPDICAPGVQIKSLDFNTTDGYTLMDGTSMATPLVAGTIALMLSKNHELTPAQIDEILERTAVKLTEHKSNDFGSGLLDALAAVNAVDYDAVNEQSIETTIFPNPSNESFTIVCEGLKQVSVYSVDGRLAKAFEVNGKECSLDNLERGVYLVRMESEKGIVNRKVVKM